MKVVAKPIDMVASFDKKGIATPIKFRIEENDSYHVIKIDKVINRKSERLAGNPMLIYTCQGEVHNYEKIFEIKYDVSSCRWILFKI